MFTPTRKEKPPWAHLSLQGVSEELNAPLREMNTVPCVQTVLATEKVPVVKKQPSISIAMISQPAVHCKSPGVPLPCNILSRQDATHNRDTAEVPYPHIELNWNSAHPQCNSHLAWRTLEPIKRGRVDPTVYAHTKVFNIRSFREMGNWRYNKVS